METLETLRKTLNNFIQLKAYTYSAGDEFINEELHQIADIAIYQAIQTYKPHSKATLKSFAMRMIEWQMKDYLSTSIRQIRLPANVVYNKDFEFKQPISADLIVNEDDATRIIDNITESPENGLNNDYIWDVVSQLSKKDAAIVKMRYIEKMTLEEIGLHFYLTKEAIRVRLNKIHDKLRETIDLDEL